MRVSPCFLSLGFTALAAAATTPLVEARGSCEKLPAAANGAPKYSPDTAAAFSSERRFQSIAAAATVPNGYYTAYSGLSAATITTDFSYIGFSTLQEYDSCTCAQRCNRIRGCAAVNIFFERAPSVNPGPNCRNPASATQIKCAYFGSAFDSKSAINSGQFREKFQVAIAGSNGYINKNFAISQAKKDIIKGSLQPYCSTLLGYNKIPTVTVTTVGSTTPVVTSLSTSGVVTTVSSLTTTFSTAIETSLVTSFATETTTTTATSTTTVATTVVARVRRGETSAKLITTAGIICIKTADRSSSPAPTAKAIARGADAVLSTPAVLAKYPGTIIASACALVATRATSTATRTVSTTLTAATSTAIVPTTSTSTITNPQIIFSLVTVTTLATTAVTTTSTTTSTTLTTATSTTTTSASAVPSTCPFVTNLVKTFQSSNSQQCGCTYDATCGRFPDPDGNCVTVPGVPDEDNPVVYTTYDSCAGFCDTISNCFAFTLQDASGVCTVCAFTGTGDGTKGFSTGTRRSSSCSNTECED